MDFKPIQELEKSIKLVNTLLSIIGIYVLDKRPITIKMKVYKVFLIVAMCTFPMFGLNAVYYHRNEFVRAIESLLLATVSFQIVSKMFFIRLASNDLLLLVETFKIFRIKYEEDIITLNMKDTKVRPKNSTRSIISVYLVTFVIILCFGFAPLFAKERTLPLDSYLPFVPPYESPFYEINYAWIVLQLISLSNGAKSYDGIFILTLDEISLQFDVIEHKLSTVGQQKEIDDEILRECVEMYWDLIRSFTRANNVFSKSFGAYLLTTMIAMPSTLLCAAAGGKLRYTLFGVGVILKVCLICIRGEIIQNKLQEFNYKLYGIEWYNLNLKQQKSLIIMMSYGQRGHSLQAMGMVDLCLATMVQIFKTAYSYYCIMMDRT